MKRFSNKQWNKLVSKVDRYFSYDRKNVKEDYTSFHSYDGDMHVHVFISKSDKYGIFIAITKKNRKTRKTIVDYTKELTTFADINQFITMVKLIG